MTTDRHVLTIDLGTSGPKAAVVSAAGVIVGSARAAVRTELGPDGAAEQDPDAVWAATLQSAQSALADAGADPASFVAVAASAQYSSIVPVDADGSAVGNMVLWIDQRGAPKRLKRLDGYPRRADSPAALLRWLRVHGLPPIDAAMSLNHMRWLRYARPSQYEQTEAFLEPVDYLTARFTGRLTANQCSAYMMLLTDNRALGATMWDPRLVAQSLIDPEKLPELVPVGNEVGTLLPAVADALGLPATTPVLSGINDTQAGAIAAGAFEGSHAGLSLGTSSVITTHVEKKKTGLRTGLFTLPSPIGDRHLLSAENGVAGVAVDHFLGQVVSADDPFSTPETVDDRYRAFSEAAEAAGAGAGGVLFLPWLRGSMAPSGDPRLRGGFLNVGLDTTRSDLARAVFEGVALNLRWLRGPVESFVKRPLSHFRFYGGGAGSDLWAQVMADVLGCPIHQLADPSFTNNLGTAMFACERLGLVDAGEVAERVPVRRVYEPDPALEARYDELAEVFVKTFKAVRPLFRAVSSTR
ncbi:FGGY-family carbohydrate kinase [soil metagenome]